MADYTQVQKQLRTDMLADTTLTALLGDTKSIYLKNPSGIFSKPFLIMRFSNMGPQTQISGVGVYRSLLAWGLYVLNPWQAGPIFSHLEKNWSIPITKPEGVASTNYRIDNLVWNEIVEIPGVLELTSDGGPVHEFSISSNIRITALTG